MIETSDRTRLLISQAESGDELSMLALDVLKSALRQSKMYSHHTLPSVFIFRHDFELFGFRPTKEDSKNKFLKSIINEMTMDLKHVPQPQSASQLYYRSSESFDLMFSHCKNIIVRDMLWLPIIFRHGPSTFDKVKSLTIHHQRFLYSDDWYRLLKFSWLEHLVLRSLMCPTVSIAEILPLIQQFRPKSTFRLVLDPSDHVAIPLLSRTMIPVQQCLVEVAQLFPSLNIKLELGEVLPPYSPHHPYFRLDEMVSLFTFTPWLTSLHFPVIRSDIPQLNKFLSNFPKLYKLILKYDSTITTDDKSELELFINHKRLEYFELSSTKFNDSKCIILNLADCLFLRYVKLVGFYPTDKSISF
ncbi:unnamed protein product [Ambrosiozyma monospora]|uniref:Unnamed protein product n=1 Tax=Ambrosiozyma monospora TaxID=43982 RepID=A0ACB5U3A1_AMBMO|nr:unnamed protein product [Ambrosiozyma monospora]